MSGDCAWAGVAKRKMKQSTANVSAIVTLIRHACRRRSDRAWTATIGLLATHITQVIPAARARCKRFVVFEPLSSGGRKCDPQSSGRDLPSRAPDCRGGRKADQLRDLGGASLAPRSRTRSSCGCGIWMMSAAARSSGEQRLSPAEARAAHQRRNGTVTYSPAAGSPIASTKWSAPMSAPSPRSADAADRRHPGEEGLHRA